MSILLTHGLSSGISIWTGISLLVSELFLEERLSSVKFEMDEIDIVEWL